MCGVHDESIVLETIVDAAERLIELGGRAPKGTLGLDRELSEQILLNLIVLGEATKRLSPALRVRFAEAPWSDMAQTRDVIVHRYDAINWFRVQEIIELDLPALLPRLREIREIVRAEFAAAEGSG